MTSTVSGTTNCDLGELDYSISIRRLSFDKRTDRTYLLKTGWVRLFCSRRIPNFATPFTRWTGHDRLLVGLLD